MNMKENIADKSGFMLSLPRITLTGNREVYVENYKGISAYTTEEVRLGTGSGIIRISGENLVIKALNTDEIVLSGIISMVELI